MNPLIVILALAGQAPATPDYDFVALGQKLANIGASADRAEHRLGLVEDKLNSVLDRLERAPAQAAPAGDDGQPWTMEFRAGGDGKEHFYVRDRQGRMRHFERPAATTVTRPPLAAPPAVARPYFAAAPLPFQGVAADACPGGACAAPAAVPAMGYFSGAAGVYTGGAVAARRGLLGGLFGGGGLRQACTGPSCSPD